MSEFDTFSSGRVITEPTCQGIPVAEVFRYGTLHYEKSNASARWTPHGGQGKSKLIYSGPMVDLQLQLFDLEAKFLGDYWRGRKTVHCPHCDVQTRVSPCWFCGGDSGIDDDRSDIWRAVVRCQDARAIIRKKILFRAREQ